MVVWEKFGLAQNPFEIKPVELNGLIPVSTFMGREKEKTQLGETIKTRNRSLSIIVGEKGIGKTSLGNVIRADLFDGYFVPIFEVDCQSYWKSQDFILQILAQLYSLREDVKLYSNLQSRYLSTVGKICEELSSIFSENATNLSGSVGYAGLTLGGGIERGGKLRSDTITILRSKFKRVVSVVLEKGYRGIILQFNNLDNLEMETKELAGILADLRDFLLTDHCHFIFLGNKATEAGFKYNSKVNDCITADIFLEPLNTDMIKNILRKRYDVFKLVHRNPIPPVTDDALSLVCELHGGNIRQVFYSLDKAVVNSDKAVGKTEQLNSSSIKQVLFNVVVERIKQDIDPRAFSVLHQILSHRGAVTNTEITRDLKLRPQNTSKYLKQLKDSNLVIIHDKIGRKIFYKPVNEAMWLKLFPDSVVQKTLGSYL